MKNKTIEIKEKIEKELQKATHQMNRADINGAIPNSWHWDYFRKECLMLRKELREINTGKTIY